MALLDDQLALDSFAFIDSEVFGESITYTPRVGSAVTIYAFVDRNVPVPFESNSVTQPFGKHPNIVVWIRKHATLGRSSIDTGGDKISVARRKGGTAEAFSVVQVIEQDAGMWKLQLK